MVASCRKVAGQSFDVHVSYACAFHRLEDEDWRSHHFSAVASTELVFSTMSRVSPQRAHWRAVRRLQEEIFAVEARFDKGAKDVRLPSRAAELNSDQTLDE